MQRILSFQVNPHFQKHDDKADGICSRPSHVQIPNFQDERISWEKRSNFTPKEDRLFIQSDVCYTKNGKDHPEGIYTCEYTHGNRLADTLIRIDGGVYDSQDRLISMGAVADNLQAFRKQRMILIYPEEKLIVMLVLGI